MGAGRAAGRWTGSSVREVLTNPKYTGHMVWNRRARKGTGRNRINPVEGCVWSLVPAHEALVDLETFVRAQQVAERRQRSRAAPGANQHPRTKRIYRLRGYVFCVQCGRRICGKASGRTTYYVCAPKAEYRPDGHPTSIWVREDLFLGDLTGFVCSQVFAGTRHRVLEAHVVAMQGEQEREGEQRLASLRSAIATQRPGADALCAPWNFSTCRILASSVTWESGTPNYRRSSRSSDSGLQPRWRKTTDRARWCNETCSVMCR